MKGHNYGLCKTCGKIHIPTMGMLNKKHSKKSIIKMKKSAKYGKNNVSNRPEVKEKLRNINRDYMKTKKYKETMSKANKGKKYSKEINLKKGKKGKENSNWHGGISKEGYPYIFNKYLKEQIRKRDKYRCQQCFRHEDECVRKVKGGKLKKVKLDIHHIDFNKKNNDINNLICLCRTCHMQTNFTRENWTQHFKNKISEEGD